MEEYTLSIIPQDHFESVSVSGNPTTGGRLEESSHVSSSQLNRNNCMSSVDCQGNFSHHVRETKRQCESTSHFNEEKLTDKHYQDNVKNETKSINFTSSETTMSITQPSISFFTSGNGKEGASVFSASKIHVSKQVDSQLLTNTHNPPIIKKLILNPEFLRAQSLHGTVNKFTLLPIPADVTQLQSGIQSIELVQTHQEQYKCSICGQIFYSKNEISKHRYMAHRGKLHSCDVCLKSFYKPFSLKMHKRIHDTERSYQCETCTMTFRTSAAFKNHMLLHSGKLDNKCPHCEKAFTWKGSLKIHVDTVHLNIRYKCEVCPKKFRQLNLLKQHAKTHDPHFHSTTHKCTICEAVYRSYGGLKRHVGTKHADVKYVCDVCGKELSSASSFQSHVRIHTGEKPFVCEICGKAFISKILLVTHSRVHTKEKPFLCKICGKGFTQRGSVTMHVRTVHSNEKMHRCHFCGKMFKTPNLLKLHSKQHGTPLSKLRAPSELKPGAST